MEGKRVLITGGAGLIGSHIAELCGGEKVKEIVVLDNFVRGRRENLFKAMEKVPVTVMTGDICDRSVLKEAMTGIDLLFHMAALRIIQCAEQPRLALEVLVDGAYNVYEAAVEAKVKKVVTASTASIYGLADDFPTTEKHHPYNNRTLYGAAKAFNEGLCRCFNEMFGMNYVALRFFNVYGPRMDMHGAYTEVFIKWMERIVDGKAPLIFGDGAQTMDFVYVEDIARACMLAAKSDISDEVFNIASGTETSLNDLARMLLKVMKSDMQPEYGPERKVNPVPRRLADVSKAETMLGFRTQVSLEDGLRQLVEWWSRKKAVS
ncbi:MAG: NAD-dependent epimerase/dehydratase family protein [Candidatus Hydrogenedentota bacterium]